jgi:hypothetical protein
MKISEPSWSSISKNNNQLALDNPQVGDYWNERFCPYFLVVAVRDDKHEPNARIMNTDDMTWSFDYSKHMVVNREWMAKAVKYSSIDGFCADVVREGMSGVVEEWKQFHRERLTKELEEMGV